MVGTGIKIKRYKQRFRSKQIVSLKYILDTHIHVSPYAPLNTYKWVVRSHLLKNEKKLAKNVLRVIFAKCIIINKSGTNPYTTDTFILSFHLTKLPPPTTLVYEKISYIPNPLRCFRCQAYGHHEVQLY